MTVILTVPTREISTLTEKTSMQMFNCVFDVANPLKRSHIGYIFSLWRKHDVLFFFIPSIFWVRLNVDTFRFVWKTFWWGVIIFLLESCSTRGGTHEIVMRTKIIWPQFLSSWIHGQNCLRTVKTVPWGNRHTLIFTYFLFTG